jgi:hypothetical protein
VVPANSEPIPVGVAQRIAGSTALKDAVGELRLAYGIGTLVVSFRMARTCSGSSEARGASGRRPLVRTLFRSGVAWLR